MNLSTMKECAICLETLRWKHTLECGHQFHITCLLNMAMDDKTSCPLCRDSMDLSVIYTHMNGLTLYACEGMAPHINPCSWVIRYMISKIKTASSEERYIVYAHAMKLLDSIKVHGPVPPGMWNLVKDLSSLYVEIEPAPTAPIVPLSSIIDIRVQYNGGIYHVSVVNTSTEYLIPSIAETINKEEHMIKITSDVTRLTPNMLVTVGPSALAVLLGMKKKVTVETLIKTSDMKIVKLLVEAGVDVNDTFNHETPIQRAAFTGLIEKVKFLIDNGADSEYAIDHAAKKNHISIIEYIVSHKATSPATLGISLPSVAALGNNALVCRMIDHGAPVDHVCFFHKDTALMKAVANKKRSTALLLRDKGASMEGEYHMGPSGAFFQDLVSLGIKF